MPKSSEEVPKHLFEKYGFVEVQFGCWIWLGPYDWNLYGQCGTWPAHRASYVIHNGPIPKGKFVCHRCNVPMCVNPKHLYCGTIKNNRHDSLQADRSRSVPRRSLKDWGLKQKDVDVIKWKVKECMIKKNKVAAEHGISVFVLNNILNGEVTY